MREIKFRAWDGEKMNYEVDMLSKWGAIKKGYSSTPWIEEASAGFSMQYTGLKDKNGKEIYEGDVVKILYTDWPSQLNSFPELSHEEYLDSLTVKKVVIWSVQGFYVSESVNGYASSMKPGKYGYIQVIGNIYENPELLK